VKTVILGRDLSRADSVLHTSSRSHGVLASNTDTVEEESPDVADDPSVLRDTPSGSKHEKADEHDDGVLNETEATTEPVTNDTNKDLTDNDTTDLKIIDSLEPGLVAYLSLTPACRESSLEKRPDITNGEEDVSRLLLVMT
jgi:hypothetical protein